MKALLIVAGILLFIVCLLSVRIRLHLDFSGTLQLELRILFLRFRLHPRKLTPKRVLRMQKKKEKKARKRAKQPAKADPAASGGTTAPKKTGKKKQSPTAILRLVAHILRSVFHKFPDCFHLYLKRCVIVIAGKDAAETAIRYGAARGALAWFCTLLDEIFTVKTTKNSVLSIDADFTGSETRVEISARLSARIGALLALLFRILIAYLKAPRPKKQKQPKTTVATKA